MLHRTITSISFQNNFIYSCIWFRTFYIVCKRDLFPERFLSVKLSTYLIMRFLKLNRFRNSHNVNGTMISLLIVLLKALKKKLPCNILWDITSSFPYLCCLRYILQYIVGRKEKRITNFGFNTIFIE